MTPRLLELLEAHRRSSMRVEGEAVGLPPALREQLGVSGRVVNGDVRRLLGFGEMKARLALRKWCEVGLLVRKGPGTRPYYVAGEGEVAGELLPRVPARPLVFPSRLGTYRTPESLHKPLADAAAKVGIGQRVTSQVLRRTFNTLLLRAGVDRTVLRSQMGHCSEAMTSRYAGVSLDDKRERPGGAVAAGGGQLPPAFGRSRHSRAWAGQRLPPGGGLRRRARSAVGYHRVCPASRMPRKRCIRVSAGRGSRLVSLARWVERATLVPSASLGWSRTGMARRGRVPTSP